jgi:hypothetical protein
VLLAERRPVGKGEDIERNQIDERQQQRVGVDLGNGPLFGYEQGIFRPDIANELVPQHLPSRRKRWGPTTVASDHSLASVGHAHHGEAPAVEYPKDKQASKTKAGAAKKARSKSKPDDWITSIFGQ